MARQSVIDSVIQLVRHSVTQPLSHSATKQTVTVLVVRQSVSTGLVSQALVA